MLKQNMMGGCQCGMLRYEVSSEAIELYVCHCRECQKQSSSAFGISVRTKASDVTLLSGTPKIWSRPAAILGSLDCAYCPSCGSRIWHGNMEFDEVISIKGGSLDVPPNLADAKHIWTSSRLDGVVIPIDAETYLEEPPI